MVSDTYAEIVSEKQFFRVSCAMIILASAFVLIRAGTQISKKKYMEAQDYLVYAAYVFFISMSICYLTMIPRIYMISKYRVGALAPWPTLKDDFVLYIRLMFVTTTLFRLSLWSVKLSLLVLYKKLMDGLPVAYLKVWWAVFTFCVISLIGCVISYMTSCPDFAAMLERGECSGPRSIVGQLASLYTSYAVDIFTDLMIMILPIRLVWNLQMARGQKVGVIALFASGFVCIGFATLRVVQIVMKTGNKVSPSPIWLGLWTLVETSIAVCIRCCPAFAVLYRVSLGSRNSYDAHGYLRHDQSRSLEGRGNPRAIKMNTVTVSTGRARTLGNNRLWNDADSSQEELATQGKEITVTTTVEQAHR